MHLRVAKTWRFAPWHRLPVVRARPVCFGSLMPEDATDHSQPSGATESIVHRTGDDDIEAASDNQSEV